MKIGFWVAIFYSGIFALSCNLAGVIRTNQETVLPEQNPTRNAVPEGMTSPAFDAAHPTRSEALLQTGDFSYLGSFRLPGEDERPRTFGYGGNAMTFNPDGDPRGGQDGFPGSLFITGHDRIPFGELPDGGQVAEINIPKPVNSKDLAGMNTAEFLQNFKDLGAFPGLDEIPKIGMVYLNQKETGPLIHLAWGVHIEPPEAVSHAWFSPDLSNPDVRGYWYIGRQDPYSVNGYMFEIPQDWAQKNSGGRVLATGRMRDGGQGGMGPTLLAYRPWQDDGSPAPDGTHLEEVPLLLYEKSSNTEDYTRCMRNYQHADEWEGGAWITTAGGKSAVLFAGTKATGDRTWYGYINAKGADQVCVDSHVTDYPTCRLADGAICPAGDLQGCCDEESGGCASLRGWWSNRFDAQLILYNPDDLARVTAGQMEAWQPQPYAAIDIDEHLLLNPPDWEIQNVGSGDQRRYRVGDVAFDRANGLLYVLEQFGDEAKPLVHVWKIE